MNCAAIQTQLSAYIDRQLPAWEKIAVKAHLPYCSACRKELRALLKIKRTLRAHRMPSLPTEVLSAIQAQTIDQPMPKPWGFVWIPTIALATAFGGWMLFRAHYVVKPLGLTEALMAWYRTGVHESTGTAHDKVVWHQDRAQPPLEQTQ